jgi:hypothetical protein
MQTRREYLLRYCYPCNAQQDLSTPSLAWPFAGKKLRFFFSLRTPVGSHRHPWLRRFALPFPSSRAAFTDLVIPHFVLHIFMAAVGQKKHPIILISAIIRTSFIRTNNAENNHPL